jgi:hypothetical protein
MAYRQPADMPTEPKKAAAPPERLVVSRYGIFPAIAIVLVSLAAAAFIAWGVYGRTRLVCTRDAAGALPRCTAEQEGLGANAVAPFDLRPSALAVEEYSSDDSTNHGIRTPSGLLTKGVTKDFAESTVAGAKKFAETPNDMRFEATRASTGASTGTGLGGLAFVVIILFIVKRTHLVIDRGAGVLRVGNTPHSLADVSAAKVEDIDDSAFYKLMLVTKGSGAMPIAEGRESECRAAAKAINRALAEKHASTRSMPEELKDVVEDEKQDELRELTDEEKWQKMETFLASLPIDGVKVVRKKKDGRIEARGTKRGLPIRVIYDPISPSCTEIEVKAKGQLGFLDLEHDPEAKSEDEPPPDPTWDDEDERRVFFGEGVFVDDAKAAKAFRSLPADLQERIVSGMRENEIRYFRIRPEETTLDSRDGPNERSDPHAHVSAMLELAAEAAQAASKTSKPSKTSKA